MPCGVPIFLYIRGAMKNFMLYLAALSAVACSKPAAEFHEETEEQEFPEPEVIIPAEDSIEARITLKGPSEAVAVRHTDIFVYGTGGLQKLEKHVRIDSLPREFHCKVTKGVKIFVAICNCPYGFNLTALDKYESMELLAFNFSEDDPGTPLLSGKTIGEGEIWLAPLLCKVVLEEISNALDGYELLESPRIYLTGANPSSEILRTGEYRPKEEFGGVVEARLPYDVGFFSQYPRTTLYCYPNDTPDDILGCIRTVFHFECHIGGEKRDYEIPLPQFTRGAVLGIKLAINSPEEYYQSVSLNYP